MNKLFTLLLFLLSFTTYAQMNTKNDTFNINDLTNKTKSQLIAKADTIIIEKHPEFFFDPNEYDITTWANSKQVIIKYKRRIRFTPFGKKVGSLGSSDLDYDFEVDLTNKTTSFDTWGMDNFYIPTPEEQEKIDFVNELPPGRAIEVSS